AIERMPYQATFSDNPTLDLALILASIPAFPPDPDQTSNPASNPASIPALILILTQAVIRVDECGPLKVQTHLRLVGYRFPFQAAVSRSQDQSAFANDPPPFGVNKIDGA